MFRRSERWSIRGDQPGQTVSTYIDLLLDLDIVEEVPNTTPRRYQVAESAVVQELFALNSELNDAGE